MSKIKKTALIGVVGASALTAGYYTFKDNIPYFIYIPY